MLEPGTRLHNVLMDILPGFLKEDGPWRFVSGAVFGACLLHSFNLFFGLGNSNGESSPAPSQRKRLKVPRPEEELKMVLCVNESLKMGKGKIGAQCAHAATGILNRYMEYEPMQVVFQQWEMVGQPKIALKVQDEEEMLRLAHAAVERGLPIYVVQDAGRTQIPAGSRTVLAIGPAKKSMIDELTGHLKLL